MIDSITVATKGGLILYQHVPSAERRAATGGSFSEDAANINAFITSVLLDPTKEGIRTKATVVEDGKVVEYQESGGNLVGFLVYPEVVFRAGKTGWLKTLLTMALREFELFVDATAEGENKMDESIPDPQLFDATFQALWKQASADKDSTVAETSMGKQQPRRTPGGGKKTTWGEAKVTKEAMSQLDYSKDSGDVQNLEDGEIPTTSNALAEARAAYLPTDAEIPAWEEVEVPLTEEDEGGDDETSSPSSAWGSSLRGWLDQVSGNKVLTAKDLEEPLQAMQKLLESKNVASDIALEICTSVKQKLVGKRMQSFARVKTAVRQGLESAITKILTPPRGRKVDIVRGVLTKRSSRGTRPYVIVFVGINGVGKSTSLAKIAYYLKQNGSSPLLAACDTFRSGAVEQLNVHAKCLDVPLYHKGYAKDPSAVATSAIAEASKEGQDVVLVDTAGRMQNNVPLMKALSKLVVENEPDLVLFVCEALVGNDGMDQLNMFNKALRSGGHRRQIDGIILTKWDTVSEKVGAALTLTHVTGSPVVFTGTGQKYNHLKPLSAQGVIKSLFS